jgi:hypothetical protein
MRLPQVKIALFSRIRKVNENGSGYVLGKGYNSSWFKALDELKTSGKIVSRGGKMFVAKKAAKKN